MQKKDEPSSDSSESESESEPEVKTKGKVRIGGILTILILNGRIQALKNGKAKVAKKEEPSEESSSDSDIDSEAPKANGKTKTVSLSDARFLLFLLKLLAKHIVCDQTCYELGIEQ